MAPPARSVVASVPDAGARPLTEVGPALDHLALDHLAVAHWPSACARARALCDDLAAELGQLVEVLDHSALTPAHPEAKILLGNLRADAGELLFRVARLAGPARVLAIAEPEGGEPDVAGGGAVAGAGDTRGLERLLDLLDGQLRDAALGNRGAAGRALPLAARFLAGICAGPLGDLAQERTGHRLTAVRVDGGVDLLLAAVPAATEGCAGRPSSPRGCPTTTPIGDL